MKKLSLAASAFLALPLIAQAALPPQYQRQRELESVITSPDVEDALQSRPIDSISTEGDDTYIVTGGDCSVVVLIVTDPAPQAPGWAGPRQYHIEVGEARCGADDKKQN